MKNMLYFLQPMVTLFVFMSSNMHLLICNRTVNILRVNFFRYKNSVTILLNQCYFNRLNFKGKKVYTKMMSL